MTPPMVQNPGFESIGPDGIPAGWYVSGLRELVSIDRDKRTGGRYLAARGSEPHRVGIHQEVAPLEDGWYTLHARVRSGGTRSGGCISIRDVAGGERKTCLPVIPSDRWVRISVSHYVKGGRCIIGLLSDADAGGWAGFADIDLQPGRRALSILGADISSLKKSEDKGGIYRQEDGTPGDALQILKSCGVNYVRLKVWVNPADGYNNKARVLEMAGRVKAMGFGLLVDFHYSDTWADPAKQFKPAAWKDFNAGQLQQAVYAHTSDVCRALCDQSTPADIVQVGNEIHNGMLWPEGSTENWGTLAALLTSGCRAVKDSYASSQVMLHLAEGGKNAIFRAWFDNAVQRGVPFDLIGASYYPIWHGTLADLQENLDDVSVRYRKDVVVVETAYGLNSAEKDGQKNILQAPSDGYALTPEGQAAMLRGVISVVRAVRDGRGAGVFYWEPAWTVVPGNGWDPADPDSGNEWENQALFDYDNRALPAMKEFSNP